MRSLVLLLVGGTTEFIPQPHSRFAAFFAVGTIYRVPSFLATSAKESVAENFLFKADRNKPKAKWIIELDQRGQKDSKFRCHHIGYVNKTLIPGEGEYLFAVSYNVFSCVLLRRLTQLLYPFSPTVYSS